jgi:hypothetical protein
MLVLLMTELTSLTNHVGIIFPDFLFILFCGEFGLVHNGTVWIEK